MPPKNSWRRKGSYWNSRGLDGQLLGAMYGRIVLLDQYPMSREAAKKHLDCLQKNEVATSFGFYPNCLWRTHKAWLEA